jgi:hypothetical protein
VRQFPLAQFADELTANQPRTVPIARPLIELLLTYVERRRCLPQLIVWRQHHL